MCDLCAHTADNSDTIKKRPQKGGSEMRHPASTKRSVSYDEVGSSYPSDTVVKCDGILIRKGGNYQSPPCIAFCDV